jgi:uncharacterized protein YbgA (DUF1722 family)
MNIFLKIDLYKEDTESLLDSSNLFNNEVNGRERSYVVWEEFESHRKGAKPFRIPVSFHNDL